MANELTVREIRPGLYKVILHQNGSEHVRQVIADNCIGLLMAQVDKLPMLSRDITRTEALQKLGVIASK